MVTFAFGQYINLSVERTIEMLGVKCFFSVGRSQRTGRRNPENNDTSQHTTHLCVIPCLDEVISFFLKSGLRGARGFGLFIAAGA